jgi:hypothetical protein
MIVKCQWPLVTNTEPQILIYDRDHTIRRFEVVTPAWEELFAGQLKIYARAHIDGTILVIDKVVQNQCW